MTEKQMKEMWETAWKDGYDKAIEDAKEQYNEVVDKYNNLLDDYDELSDKYKEVSDSYIVVYEKYDEVQKKYSPLLQEAKTTTKKLMNSQLTLKDVLLITCDTELNPEEKLLAIRERILQNKLD